MEATMESKEDSSIKDAPKASMDVQSLNNLVVSLRNLMKKVQLYSIQKLVKKSKDLRTRRCTEERKKENIKKAEKLILEVGAIKQLNIDQAIKFALGNTSTFSALAASTELNIRAKGRLATHPLMTTKVEEWRKEHEDWKSLTAFISSKNTGRRMKHKNKKKTQEQTEDESDPKQKPTEATETSETSPETKAEKKANIPVIGDGKSARELARLAKKKHKWEKLKKVKTNEDDDQSSDGSETDAESDDGNETGGENEGEEKESENVSDLEEDNPSEEKENDLEDESNSADDGISEDGSNSGDESNSKDDVISGDDSNPRDDVVPGDESNSKDDGLSGNDSKPKSEEMKSASKSENTVAKKTSKSGDSCPKVKKISSKNTKESTQESQKATPKTKAKKVKKEIKPFIKRSGEMVISKIDVKALSTMANIPLDDAEESTSSMNITADDAEVAKVATKKKQDNFFLTGDSDDEDEGEDEEGDCADKNESPAPRNVGHPPDRKISKRKMESAFVSNLGEKRSRMWYSDFNDEEDGYEQNKYRQAQESKHKGSAPGSRSQQSGSIRPNQQKRQGQGRDDGAKKEMEAESLHPSWEAQRKKKEQEKNIFSYAGKRTTFDD